MAPPSSAPATAKFVVPLVKNSIPRPRLLRRLGQAEAAPVAWLHAPPGAGKTQLLASYLRSRLGAGVWYELDASDRDVSGLFHHLRLAAEYALEKPLELPALVPGAPVGLDGFARRYFRALFEQLPPDTWVAFDNYQVAGTPELALVFREMLGTRPRHVRLLVASREPPPPPLARFRTARELEVIDFDELRFDEREVRQLVKKRGGALLESSALWRATDGWAVAVSLLSGVLRQRSAARKAPAQAHTEEAMQAIFDFLAGEILEGIDPERRAFLLAIALFPHFDAKMAAELTERDDAEDELERVHKEQLLLDRTAEGQYRLHDLFRSFLVDRARREFSREALAALQVRAAKLLDARGYFETACGLLAAAEDVRTLAVLTEERAPELAQQGRVRTIALALESIPNELRVERPWLLFWSAVTKLGRAREARELAEAAFRGLHAAGDVPGMYSAWSVVVQALVVEADDFAALLGWLERKDELPPLPPIPPIAMRVAMSEIMGWAYVGARYDEDVRARAARAVELVRAYGTPDELLTASATAAMLFFVGGEQVRARTLLATARESLGTTVKDPLAKLVALHVETLISATLGGEFRKARPLAVQALELAETESIPAFNGHVLVLDAMASLALDDLAGARSAIARLRADPFVARSSLALGQLAFAEAWYELERGDIAASQRALAETTRQAGELGFQFARSQCANAQLILAGITRDPESLERALAYAETTLGLSPLVAAGSALAAVHAKLCWGESPIAELRSAVEQARRANWRGDGFFGRRVIQRLGKAALAHGIETDYVVELLRSYEVPPDDEAVLVRSWPWPIRVRVLGTLELELEGQRVEFGRKLPAVPIALLKLLAVAGAPVPIEKLMRALWPGYASAAPRGPLDTAVYRLRKLLGREAAVEHAGGTLCLARELCWTDVRAFELVCDRLDELGAPGLALDAERTRLSNQLAELYRGPLAGEGDPLALVQAGNRLEQRFQAASVLTGTLSASSA